MRKEISISKDSKATFYNHMDYCIGTGRMGLALQQEYLDQLKLVQDEIGFRHIRGHGLFSDDMAIYREYRNDEGTVSVEYNFTYLDLVMDSYRKLGLKPFLELGFMPGKLACGTKTVFYWKGNITPPKDYEGWCALVQATLRHLMERYGADEVITWPVEVWNEPNLPVFWENADMQEYFKLFRYTFFAIKEVDLRFRVGGPAVCGGSDKEWIQGFLDYCSAEKIPVDFVTRHHYTTELPERDGHYGYAKLSDPEYGFTNLESTRKIIDSFEEFRGLEIHITEFNTSYIPNCPLHDTNINAAYLAEQLSRLGDGNASYSYWTFGDIFEEQGVPFSPFHGGFGLVANHCIKKPTFWTFVFYKKMTGEGVYRDKNALVVKQQDGSYRGVLWNVNTEETCEIAVTFETGKEGELYSLLVQTVDEEVSNPLKVWHDLGEPLSLSESLVKLLQTASNPLVTSQIVTSAQNKVRLNFSVKKNGVIYFELTKRIQCGDRGYSFERANHNMYEKITEK